MGERARIVINEYSALELLKNDNLDLDKFYNSDLKIFIKVLKKEINRLNQEISIICKNDLLNYKRGYSDGKKAKKEEDKYES